VESAIDKELLKKLRRYILQDVYVVVSPDEKGARLCYQVKKALSKHVHYIPLPSFSTDYLLNFKDFEGDLDDNLVNAALTRRTLTRLKGVMLSQFLTTVRESKQIKIPTSIRAEAATILVNLFMNIKNRHIEEPHTMCIECGNGYIANEVSFNPDNSLKDQCPLTYHNELTVKEEFNALKQDSQSLDVQALFEEMHVRTILPKPFLNFTQLVRLTHEKFRWKCSDVEVKLNTLIGRGYISYVPFGTINAQLRVKAEQYFDRLQIKNTLSSKIWGCNSTSSVIMPILYTTENMDDELIPLYEFIRSYCCNVIRRPIEQNVRYTLLQLGSHYFIGTEYCDVIKAPDFSKEDLQVNGGLDTSAGFQLKYISSLKNSAGMRQADIFSILNTKEGSINLARTVEQLLYVQEHIRLEEQLENTNTATKEDKNRVHLSSTGYLIGQYLNHFYGEVLNPTYIRYEEHSIQNIKSGLEDKTTFLHTWYQLFRRIHEEALVRLQNGEKPI
jgi:hypothetical protein